MIVVGPDGEKQSFTLGGKGGANLFKGLTLGDGEGQTIVLSPDGKKRTFTLQGKGKATASGKAIIIGPDGQKREFDFGGDSGDGPHMFQLEGPGQDHFFRLHTPEGEEPKPKLRRLHEGHNESAAGTVRGHIVIVGPDGKEQVFDFGGGDGMSVRRKIAPLRPMELRDGPGSGTHLFRWQEDEGPAKERKVIRLRGQGGGVL